MPTPASSLQPIGACGNVRRWGDGTCATHHGGLRAKDETVFIIDSCASEATFTIHEIFLGQPNTVVGKTSQVAGQILVNKQDPSKSRVGQIKVDVSTLVTDSDLCNRTLQNHIFETGDSSNQCAIFTPKSLIRLCSTIAVGQTGSFQITR